MSSSFFKKFLIVLFLVQTVVVFSQDSKALAKAYLIKAKESFKVKDNSSVEKYLNKSIQYFGENQPKELALLATKFYASNKKFQKAKKYAELYFKVEKNKDSKEYNEMLLTFIDIEDNIDSGVVVQKTEVTVKEVKKEIPTVIKTPKKLTSKKLKAKVGKTLREAYLLSKKYYSLKKYDFAKQNLDRFFALNPKKGTRFYKEMQEVKSKVDNEFVEIVEDEKDVEETVIESTETDEGVTEDVVETIDENVEKSDVSFAIIEEVPIFPGCSGTRKEKVNCLNVKIKNHIGRKFNAELVNDLGLSPGVKKIWISFRINEEGRVEDVFARAPHPKLKKEGVRVVSSLPKMEPGKQSGKPVGMKYSIPISFNVEAISKTDKDN